MTNSMTNRLTRPLARCIAGAGILTGIALLAGCHDDMWIQPKVKPYQQSDFFADGQSARPLVPGVVPRRPAGDLRLENPLYSWTDPATGKLRDTLPPGIPLNVATLKRGQERFNIYCSPCHGRIGDGKGMIAQRGLALRKQPQNFHAARMRAMPLGHFYDVITNGFGVMYNYAQRVEPVDRWKIAAYIRVLQYSENARVGDVPPDAMPELNAAPAGPTTTGQPGTAAVPTAPQPASNLGPEPGAMTGNRSGSEPVNR